MNNVQNHAEAKIFRNPLLQALTKTSPAITLCAYVPVMAALILFNVRQGYMESPLVMAGVYFAGILVWTFTEYIMHRYVFHFIRKSAFVQKLHFFLHGVHHEYPRDVNHLFMPPVAGWMFVAVFFLVFYVAMGNAVYVFLPGFINGYLLYSFTHFFIHSRKPPRRLKFLWKHHQLHHYKHNDKAFGVSSPLWDYVFATMPEEEPSAIGRQTTDDRRL